MKLFTNSSLLVGVLASTVIAAPATVPQADQLSNMTNAAEFYHDIIPAYTREATPGLAEILTIVTKLLPPPLANALQNGVAEIFKGGDAVLNVPLDAVEGVLNGDPKKAVGGTLKGIVQTIGSLPKDAANILGVGKQLTGPMS